MLTVGESSYVTLAEADDYIKESYRSTDNLRVLWEALEDSDREILLQQSLYEIERLILVGCKTYRLQKLSFPRNGAIEVDSNIKYAQIENAIGILYADTKRITETQDNIADSLGLVKNIKRPNLRLRGEIGTQGTKTGTVPSRFSRLLTNEFAVEFIKGWLR